MSDNIEEEKLPKTARHVLAIMREEMAVGRLTQEEADWVKSAVQLKSSLGFIGNWIVKFASWLGALTAIYLFFKGVIKP